LCKVTLHGHKGLIARSIPRVKFFGKSHLVSNAMEIVENSAFSKLTLIEAGEFRGFFEVDLNGFVEGDGGHRVSNTGSGRGATGGDGGNGGVGVQYSVQRLCVNALYIGHRLIGKID
jgi:hypothetical protein